MLFVITVHHCPALPSVTSNVKCPTCNVLPSVLDVNFNDGQCRSSGVDYNNTCVASCDEGYTLEGHSHYWCNEHGHWNATTFPHCKSESTLNFHYHLVNFGSSISFYVR